MTISNDDLLKMRDELLTARLSGALRVKFQGRDVTYKSDAEMAKALKAIDAELGNASGTALSNSSLAEYDTGLT